jgi:hypothetical protein
MSDCIAKCREPQRTILSLIDSWVTTTYPDVVVTEPDSLDKEGWVNYAVPNQKGGATAFAGMRFRRDKPTGFTVVLAAQPLRDPEEWVHANQGKLRPMGFAFGLPRPFKKDVSDAEWNYVFELLRQAYDAVASSS